MKQLLSVIVVAASAGLFAVPGTQAFGADYRLLSTTDDNYPPMKYVLHPFVKNVAAATKGSINIKVFGPEAVPPMEQLQPVGSGAFQFAYATGAYHFGTTPFAAAIEALGGDLQSRRAAGLWEVFDKHYEKFGLKLVALTMSSRGGYQIFLREPVGPSGNLQGRKLRGTATYHSVFKMLEASTVTLPFPEIYTSLEKGVTDGSAFPTVGMINYRWYEVAKYLLRPTFGYVVHPIFMNLAAWNKLTNAERKILLQEGRKIEDQWYVESVRVAAEEEKALLAKGAIITQLGQSQKARLDQAFSDGLWEITTKQAKKDIDELHAWARSKGLAN